MATNQSTTATPPLHMTNPTTALAGVVTAETFSAIHNSLDGPEKVALQTAKASSSVAKALHWASGKLGKSGFTEGTLSTLEEVATPAAILYSVNDVMNARDGQIERTAIKDAAITGGSMALAQGAKAAYTAIRANSAVELAAGAETAEVGSEIVAGAAAIPAAIAGSAGLFLYRDIQISNLRHAHEDMLKTIKPDMKKYSNLQGLAVQTDAKAVSAYKQALLTEQTKRPLSEAEKAFLKEDFVRDSQGHIDIHNAKNVTPLRHFITAKREETSQLMIQKDQLGTLPDGLRLKQRQIDYFDAEIAQRRLAAAGAEVNQMALSSGAAIAEQSHIRKPPAQLESVSFMYTDRDGNFNKASDANPNVPDDVRREYLQNLKGGHDYPIARTYTHDGVIENVTWAIRNDKVPLSADPSELYTPIQTPRLPKNEAEAAHKPLGTHKS